MAWILCGNRYGKPYKATQRMYKAENRQILETVEESISTFQEPETDWDRQKQGLGVDKLTAGLLEDIS